jgi:hypothetical protein
MTTTDTRPDIPLGHTYDDNDNMLTYRDGCYWSEYTYDANGNEATYKNSGGVEWTAIVHAAYYTLGYDSRTHKYHAGCRVFTRAEALAHWGTPRDNNAARAAIFVAAISNHKE